MLKPVNRTTLHREVMQQMTAAIREGQWEVGSKLPGEMALAEIFQVSRTCIREVLKALAYSGVVESRSGVGTFLLEMPHEDLGLNVVDMLTTSSYTELLEMRKLLEGQAAYWASERATPEDLDRLGKVLAGEGEETLNQIHYNFHTCIVALSKNSILIHMVTELLAEFKKLRDLNFTILPDADRLEHWQVFEAIQNGPPARARKLMSQHVDFVWKKSLKQTTVTDIPGKGTPKEPLGAR